MVEVSSLYDLDIYTIAGQYVGRVADVVLNIKYGTISKLRVKALEPEKKNVGIRDIFSNGLKFVPEEEGVPSYQEGLLDVNYDKVKAIGDIMLIDPQDLIQKTQQPKVAPMTNVEAPKPEAPRAPVTEPEIQTNIENKPE
jgi:sporulation protein YlmC with PRC-barrel domain